MKSPNRRAKIWAAASLPHVLILTEVAISTPNPTVLIILLANPLSPELGIIPKLVKSTSSSVEHFADPQMPRINCCYHILTAYLVKTPHYLGETKPLYDREIKVSA